MKAFAEVLALLERCERTEVEHPGDTEVFWTIGKTELAGGFFYRQPAIDDAVYSEEEGGWCFLGEDARMLRRAGGA